MLYLQRKKNIERAVPVTRELRLKKNGFYICDTGYDSVQKKHGYKTFMLYNDCTVLGGANLYFYETPGNAAARILQWYRDADSGDRKIWGCYNVTDDQIVLQRPIPGSTGLFAGEWDVLNETGKVLSDTSVLISQATTKGSPSSRDELYIFFELPSKPDSTNWLRTRMAKQHGQ